MSVAFRITGFGGIAPRVAARLLANNMAQVASNLKITSGELGPVGSTFPITMPAKTMPPLSMFLARNGLTSSAWFTWPTDVDVVRAPLSVDVESRFYWTGDGEPRYATFSKATLSGLNDYPSNYWTLGVPTPLAKPVATPDGLGTGAAVTRLYCITFFSELGEESGMSPASIVVTGKIDDTWALSNLDAVPPNSGDIISLVFTGKSVTIGTTNNHFNRVGEEVTIAGVTTVTNVNGTWLLTAVDPVAKTMTFSVTSAPVGTYNDATDTTDTWARAVLWNTTNMKRRLYRSAGTIASFQLVIDDIPTGSTYNDTILDKDILGDELISATWAPPPVGMKGIVTHPSGSVIGFVGNLVCPSEPYQPHAFPPEYQEATDYDIVGLAVFGSEILVATLGNPYVANGTDPANFSMEKTSASYPCLSKRGIVPVGNGALYPTKQGMAFVGDGGFKIYTEDHYTEDEWEPLNPASMFSEFTNERVYIGYTDTNGNPGILVFNKGDETTMDIACSDLYTDVATGNLYLGDSTGIHLWDSIDSNPLGMTWRSRDFTLATPVNLGAAKIEFEQVMSDADISALVAAYAAVVASNDALIAAGDIGGEVDGETVNTMTLNGSSLIALPPSAPSNAVSFTLYLGKRVIFSRVVTSTKAFRLPAGIKYDSFSVEVTTQNKVRSILVGETIESLKQA